VAPTFGRRERIGKRFLDFVQNRVSYTPESHRQEEPIFVLGSAACLGRFARFAARRAKSAKPSTTRFSMANFRPISPKGADFRALACTGTAASTWASSAN
jgi:hypothetical protein